jgi:predicted lipid-binding transport protein (Tim44 family)
LGALWWGIFGIAMVGIGDAWFLLGIVFLVLSFRSFAWLFASRDEWAKRKSSGIGRRTFFPSQKSSSAQNQVSINHNRTERIKKRAKRQAKRQAFFQAPTTKIAVGFISMMLVYALLF